MGNIISLVGMSGVGKTYFALSQNSNECFNYSVDFVLAKVYLKDKHFNSSSVKINDLSSVSTFLSKFGSKGKGGLDRDEFLRRQELYAIAEQKATVHLKDISNKIFSIGYKTIVNDLTGSICEIINPDIENFLKTTEIKYLPASDEHIDLLIKRAKKSPKPLLFSIDFFTQIVDKYKDKNNIKNDDDIDPNDFCKYSFPLLVKYRIPKYEYVAKLNNN
jgi:hypothetical protein